MIPGIGGRSLGSSVVAGRNIQLLAAIASLVITTLVVYQDAMPNRDGVLYLLAAELIVHGQWNAALALHALPLYSALIALMHLLTNANMELSAYLLNALLQALLVVAFIGAVLELGVGKRIALIAAFLILSYPDLNEYRSDIIRDFGYWAFFMLAVWFYLKHLRTQGYGSLFSALGALFLATLFRIEGMVFLGLLPVALLLNKGMAPSLRWQRLVIVYLFFSAGAFVTFMLLPALGMHVAISMVWDLAWNYAAQTIDALHSDFAGKAGVLRDQVLSRYSEGYAGTIVALSILLILVVEVASSIGWIYGLLAVFAIRTSGQAISSDGRKAVFFFITVNFAVLLTFVIRSGFLTGRYPLALTLLVMLLAPYGAFALYRSGRKLAENRGRLLLLNGLFLLCSVYLLADGLVSFSAGKVHHRDAAEWLRHNLSPDDRLLGFDTPILYRAGRLHAADDVKLAWSRIKYDELGLAKLKTWKEALVAQRWWEYDYVVASIGRKETHEQQEVEQVIGMPPMKSFFSSRGDRVLIYAIDRDPTASMD